ncbi:MAG: serine hydrolase [Desulfotignum sp.]|nr:serine hydrolase [Desulfotignum sp.]
MKQIVVILMMLSLTGILEGSETAHPFLPLPLNFSPELVRPLCELADRQLQDQLEQRLNQTPLWRKLIREKKMTVGLVDLADPSEIRFAGVNGNEMIYAASLPKIAILLAAFYCFENRMLEQTPEITRDLHLMIRRSDNHAATRMIERVGMERIQQVLTLNGYEFYDAAQGGGLWVGKEYARTGRRLPEPIKGLSHAATASQVCRFYYQLAMGKLISRERSREMLEILVNPGIEHKFVSTLKKTVPQAFVFRKSGTWKTWHSDSVLVWGPEWRRYIAVALIDNPNGETILRKLIPALEAVLTESPAHRHAARSL